MGRTCNSIREVTVKLHRGNMAAGIESIMAA